MKDRVLNTKGRKLFSATVLAVLCLASSDAAFSQPTACLAQARSTISPGAWEAIHAYFSSLSIGEAPHEILGAFERLEGANPAVRIFLQSPAAAGLELAARLSGRPADDAVDDRPLARGPRGRDRQAPRSVLPWTLALGLIATVTAVEYRSRP